MDEERVHVNLIEHMLMMLSDPENDLFHKDSLYTQKENKNQLNLQDSHDLQIAKEIIQFMDEMPGGFLIYHADDEEKIIYANRALLRIFQCDSFQEFQEITGNSFKGIVYRQDLERVEESIWEQISASQYDLDYVEYRIVRKDGSIGWIEDYGHFVHSESIGDIFYVFMGDATEKKKRLQTEKAMMLKESLQKEQKLQNLIEEYDRERNLINQEYLRRLEVIEGLSVNYESILYVDLEADLVLPYRLSNRTKEQFVKTDDIRQYTQYVLDYANSWVHPEDREMVLKATDPGYIREKLAENKTYYINYRVIENKQIVYLQLRVVNVGNKENISQIVMGYRREDDEILYEMEQQRILEEALKNVNLANVAKNTFLSNMSHDMRTPLNAIFGYTALAQKNVTDAIEVQNYLRKIETSSRQLLDLISKVLEISWTESKDFHVTESECNLNDILHDIHRTLFSKASEKNISFYLSTAGLEHCDVISDGDKLRQLLLYLVDNAVTYTKHGGRVDVIAMELEQHSMDHAVYQFVIRDTGIGIKDEFLEHIFEPFEREKNTTFSGIHGTGLGLTIARNITHMLGGNIEVESAVGMGSTFTVTFRLRIQDQLSSTLVDTDAVISGLMNRKILLVDDNDINLEIESEILHGLGFQTDLAEDGSIAVEKIKNSQPGEYVLVLMDIQMPVMNGWQATRAIRNLETPALANIPIIALSANAFESDKRASIESGMDAHLEKPMDVPMLLETVAKTIQKRK